MEQLQESLSTDVRHGIEHLGEGAELVSQGKLHEALAHFQSELERDPKDANAMVGMGMALHSLGQYDEAMALFKQAILLDPDNAEAHGNLGILHLLQGNYTEGWPEYEWRYKSPARAREFSQPFWEGQGFADKTVLLHATQRLSDTLNFCRFIPLVKAKGGRVVVECQPELRKIVGLMHEVDEVYSRGEELPEFDYHLPMLALPRLFQTDAFSIPGEIPYLKVSHNLRTRWQKYFAKHKRMRVGVVWSRNPDNPYHQSGTCPLEIFQDIFKVPGVQFYNLHKDLNQKEVKILENTDTVIDIHERLKDFQHTAACISNLDLIIAVDTATAHLAGALGKAVWMLLPFVPDWRWRLEWEDTPWYPNTRLFRQHMVGDWESVITDVIAALRHYHK
ncbi:MAG: hypothetical protein CMF50_09665 [Legionellales bacterium]|nr:hypothetical protein [Legionellales bacterium]|tara:strand:- start:4690 stop:5862 length:1173 start_codon:yes stop_codon:yes gene_type:complete